MIKPKVLLAISYCGNHKKSGGWQHETLIEAGTHHRMLTTVIDQHTVQGTTGLFRPAPLAGRMRPRIDFDARNNAIGECYLFDKMKQAGMQLHREMLPRGKEGTAGPLAHYHDHDPDSFFKHYQEVKRR